MDKSEKEGKQRDPLDFMPHHLRDTFINGTTEEAARAISELEQWSRVTGSHVPLETVGMLYAKRDSHLKNMEKVRKKVLDEVGKTARPSFARRIMGRVRRMAKI